MASRKVTLLLVAGVVAIGTVMAARGLMQPTPEAQQTAPVIQTTQIAAASRDLPTGTILKESDIKWIPWATGADTSSMYVQGKADLKDITGAVVRDGFHISDPILSGHIAQPHDQGFLAAVLTPGMRAMSIPLSPATGVAGFVFPGDHVDVILTHSFSRKDVSDLTERRVSEIILQNVRVLALDQRSDNQATDPKVAQIATLEVDEKEAEKLALAADMTEGNSMGKGMLSLVLRSLASDDPTASDKKPTPTWDSDVSAAYPAVNGEDGLMQRVQIMRGKTVTEDTFERHR
ncbi:MAG: Flp pilus assembly protein CpaB [Alphaproteobacteria bacterium]|nr:Flp pilus assembly protein CpaB [Alphaproteobacteria bacterium]